MQVISIKKKKTGFLRVECPPSFKFLTILIATQMLLLVCDYMAQSSDVREDVYNWSIGKKS